jgi:2-methylcitrate dehydratase PrpD
MCDIAVSGHVCLEGVGASAAAEGKLTKLDSAAWVSCVSAAWRTLASVRRSVGRF